MKKIQLIVFIWSIVAISCFAQAPANTNVYTNFTGAWSGTNLNLTNQGPNNVTMTGSVTSTGTITSQGTALGPTSNYGNSNPEYKFANIATGNSTTTVTINFSSPVRDLIIPALFVRFGQTGSYIQASYTTPTSVVRDLSPAIHSNNTAFVNHTLTNNRITYNYDDQTTASGSSLYQSLIWTADGDVSSVTFTFVNIGTNTNSNDTQVRIFPMTWIPQGAGVQPSTNPDLDAQLCEGINVAFVLDRSGSMDAFELDSVRQGVLIGLNELEQATAVNRAMMIDFGSTPNLGLAMTDITSASISPGGAHYNYLTNSYSTTNESTNWQDALVMVTNQITGGAVIDMVVFVSDGFPNKDDNVAVQGITSYYLDEIIPYANTLKNLGTHLVLFGTGGLTDNSGQEISSFITDQTDPLAYNIGSDVREVDYAIADNFSDFPPLFLNFFNDCVTQANFPPVAVDDYYTTPLNTPLVVNAANGITPNDNDPDGDILSVVTTPISGPPNGSITLASDGSFTYTPNTGFFGVDSVQYQTCDPGGLCDTAYIYITVEKTDLQLIKTASYNDANGNGCLDAGEVVTYLFTINNIGNVSVSQITLEDPVIGISEYACGTGSLGGDKTRSCTADYTVQPGDLVNGSIVNTATVNGIDANSAPISDISSNSTATPSTPTTISTCDCTPPALTLGPMTCNSTGFTVDFFTDGTISNVSHGTVSGGSVINIPFGVTLDVTSSSAVGCDITQSVIIPATCPTNCVFPDLSVGQPICTGSTYGVIFNESTGATVTTTAGTISGNTIINIPVGTDITVSAANGACVSSFVVDAPTDCGNPCGNPLVSVSNASCSSNGAATYSVNFIATTGASVSASHGTVSGNSIINVPSGQDLTVTASLAGCDNTVLVVPASTCPDCIAPALTVGNMSCDASGFSIDFITDGTVTSNVGTVSGNSIINIPLSSTLVVTATSTPGCTSEQTVVIPATCPNNCVFPDLSVGQPICDGTTYSVIFNESTGATVSASAGTISGNTITGIPVNTDVTVSAANGACVVSFAVTAPTNCDDPCANPLVGVSNAACNTGGAATYSVNFVARTGAVVTVSHGTISGNSIIGIPSGQDLTVTASFDGCDNTVLVVPAATCPDCVVPALTLGNLTCDASGYSVDFITDGTVTSNVGTISGNSIINIPFSSNLIVTATSTPGCTSAQLIIIPASCPINCVFPDLSVGQPICDGTTYSVIFNESTGAVVSTSHGTISGFVISGIPIGTNVTVSASNGACTASFVVAAPTNCDDPCANPLVGVSNAVCNPPGAATYAVNFVARTGAVVTVSHGTISGNSIIGIPSGQDLTVTASFDGCSNTVLVVPAATCPDCVVPALTVGNLRCNASGFSVDFITDGTVTSNVGTVSGNSIINIPLSSNLVVTATSTPGCTSEQTIVIPATCPNNCVFPDLSVGQPICDGTTYSVIFNESTGATVSASAGTISGNTITGIPVNTDVTVSAANGACVASFVVTAPTNCDDPCANPLVGVSNAACNASGNATYSVNFVARTGAVVTVSHGSISGNSIIGIPSGQDLTVTASFDGCENTVLVVPAATCPDCVVPALTVGNMSCDASGFSVDFITDGTVTSNVGTVSGNSIINIPLSSNLVVTATSTPGCTSEQTIVIPATCPNNCVFPDLSVGQPICDGTTYSVIFNESTGATVSASAGTISGNTITGIPVNTDVTVSAANGACVASFVVTAPTNCDDPCANPLVGVSNAACNASGNATYSVNFVARTGATVTVSHGSISGNSIIGIPSGQDLTVTASFDGCENTVLVVPAATCPDCVVPALTVGNMTCNASGFSIDFITDGTVTSNVGTVSGNSIINIPLSSNLVVTATSTPGCTTEQTIVIPATCPNNCAFPDLSVGQPICDVTTYSVVFNESTGATVTASAGTISGSIVTGIPIGTDVTVSAANGACVASFVVTAPTNCGDPCANPLVGVSNGVCDAGGAATYEVNFVARTGAIVTVSHGTISGNSIINIPSGQDLTVTASFPGCENTVLVVPAAACPECIVPALTLGNLNCTASGFTVDFISDGTISTSAGTISGTSIINIPFSTTLVVTASAGVGCTTTQSVVIPATCPTNCGFPDLSVGQAICDITTYSVVFNESTGATVTASAGSISGNIITGIPINTDVSVSASNGSCTTTIIVSAPTNCDDPCANPLVGVSNAACDVAGAATYTVNFVARTGATVSVSAGTISGNTIINVPSGQDLTVTASFDGCESTVLVVPGAICPDCIVPALTVGNLRCNSSGFSVDFISNGTVTSNVGTVSGNSIINIPFSSSLVVTGSFGPGCVTSQTVLIPATCPNNCFFPDMSVGQPICNGGTYSVVFNESTGATITTTAGTISGNTVINIPVGTDITLSAANGDCVAAFVITSPTNCGDPCGNPLVAVSNGNCIDDGSETYEVQFILSSGASLTTSAGTIDFGNGVITGIPSGTDLTVTASLPGCPNTELVVPAATCECPLVASVDLVDPTDCELNNGSITINASSGTNLRYSINGGISFEDANIFFALAAGSYDIVVRSNDGGCELNWGTAVLSNAASPITVNSIFPTNPTTCTSNDGQIAIGATGVGNVEYSIDGGMTFQPTGLFTGLGIGIYDFIIRNIDGTCPTVAGPVQLTTPSAPEIDFVEVINSLDCGSNDGVIVINGSGGFPPYQYSIDGGASWSNSNTFFQLAEGSYDIAIRNADQSCELGGLTVDVIAKNRPLYAGAIKGNTTCNDDGALLIAAAGGQNPGFYQVSIDNGATWVNSTSNGITTFTNLAAGTYTPLARNLDQTCQLTFPDATLLSICADLRLSKTADVAIGNIGEDVVFAVEVCNDGPAAATGVFVDDLLPSGYAYQSYTATTGSYNSFTGIWNVTEFGGNIANGSCDTIWITGTVNPTGIYNNVAQVAASDIDDPDSEPNNGVPTEDDQDNVDLPINTVPTAVNDAVTTLEDTPVTYDVTNNDDFGANGPSASAIEIVTGPSNGTGAVVNNGSPTNPTDDLISYDPDANFFGMDTIVYRICDVDGDCDTAIHVITITSVDEVPTAVDDATITLEDVPVTVDVTDNDDFGGDGASITDIVIPDGMNGLLPPSNGTVTLVNGGDNDPTNDEILYTPNPGYNGTDQFAYQICDIDNDCDIAIVDITITLVDEQPIATDDVTTTLEDTDVTINVTGNDDFGGDGPSTGDITLPDGSNGLIQPTNGTITLVNGGDNDPTNDEVLYSPDPNFHGSDQFEYIICDIDNDCDTALVTITISSVDEFPVAVDDATVTDEDSPVTIDVTEDDDFMGDGPSSTDINIPDGVNGLQQPANGTVTLVNGGDNDPTNDEVIYTPDPNFAGVDQFEYEICDADNDCDIAVVDITVTPINDPPVAVNDISMTDENIPVVIDVLGNDSDVDGILVVSTVDVIVDPLNGMTTVNPDGSVTYDPNPGFHGVDSFTYAVCDDGNPNPILCDTAIAYITIDQICTDFNISVILEGSYAGLGGMRTSLNDLHLLPGQDIALSGNPIAPIVGEQTPVGQPYNVSPWNHNGIEGDRYGDPVTNTNPNRVAYDADVVDWVLVSVRAGDSLTTSQVWRCAGLLKSDGAVEFPNECDCLISTPGTKYYIVVEHRNHLPVMSNVVYDVNQVLSFDFRIQDSWVYEIFPGFELGVGQKEIATNVYVMYGANGAQSNSVFNRRDINSSDNSLWFSQTGSIFKYRSGDYDMNADINSGDNTMWFINAGTTFTQMPLNSED